MPDSILILGAGAVGLACALALAEAGKVVTLIDRDPPFRHASRWNAGVLATSSLIPLNNPGLAAQLPRLLAGRSPAFRLAPRAALRALPWGLGFLAASRGPGFAATVAALDGLIRLSMAEHRRLLRATGAEALLSDQGWLHLYETEAAFAAAAPARAIYDRRGVAYAALGPAELTALEPHLAPRFARALLLTGSAAIREPALALAAYLARFHALGGRTERVAVARLDRGGPRPTAILEGGDRRTAAHIVIAAGPWSAQLLGTAGLRLPLMSERGYVRRFALREGAALTRPVYDAAGGLVLAPRPEGVQLSTGTELTRPDLAPLDRQRDAAARRAATLLPLGEALAGFDAGADRPTLPDSRPAIGALARAPGFWLCAGHQHIGFSTSTGSAALLAALIAGAPPPLDPAPFAPSRFGL